MFQISEKTLPLGGTALLFDLKDPSLPPCRPVAATARIDSMEKKDGGYILRCRIAEGIRIKMLLRLSAPAERAEAVSEDGRRAAPESLRWNEETHTLYLSFPAFARAAEIRLEGKKSAGGEAHG